MAESSDVVVVAPAGAGDGSTVAPSDVADDAHSAGSVDTAPYNPGSGSTSDDNDDDDDIDRDGDSPPGAHSGLERQLSTGTSFSSEHDGAGGGGGMVGEADYDVVESSPNGGRYQRVGNASTDCREQSRSPHTTVSDKQAHGERFLQDSVLGY